MYRVLKKRHSTWNFGSYVECRVISLDDGVSTSSEEVLKYFDTI
jgi:hypothetical protein